MPITIVFAGTPEFAVPSLQALIDDDAFEVVCVITQPDKPIGRKRVITPSPVKVLAEEAGILIWQPGNINEEWADRPCVEPPDFLVVAAYGQLLTQEILDFPSIAPVNVHASLLPLWRGAAPIHHAILHGDSETGVTIQRMVRKLDQGPILHQASISIHDQEHTGALYDRLSHLGATTLIDTLKAPLTPVEQANNNATFCTKLKRSDGIVDPTTMTAQQIDRHVRALIPWPGVTCTIGDTTIKILETTLEESPDAYDLLCKDDTHLSITKLQVPGKKPTKGSEWSA
ncbi:MAG: methionyl-tRNA formyltransferase [bacterium]|nr:methionyl-tRNA formyltransferase [bacterium]